MSLWRQLSRGLRVLRNREAADEEIGDEVRHYLEETTAAFAAKGLTPDEARRAARMEMGSALAVREEVREFLQYSTHFFAECQAVNAYENTSPNPRMGAIPVPVAMRMESVIGSRLNLSIMIRNLPSGFRSSL